MNIEKTISEHAVSDILTPMLESQDRIVTEDVAPLFDQATGLDTPPASGSVTTTIEESRSVITAIIRKAWTATLTMLGGASVISYITAAYTYLRNRLQGNETYGIPDRRSEISASSPLAANLALLNDRKIDVGESYIPDGMWLAPLICSEKKDSAYSLIDNSPTPWAMVSVLPFYGLTALRLNCSSSVVPIAITMPDLKSLSLPELVDVVTPSSFVYQCGVEDTVELPKLKYYRSTTGGSNYFFSNLPNVEVISLPELLAPYGDAIMFMANNPELREIYLPKVTQIYLVNNAALSNNPKLEKIVFGDYPTITYRYGNNGGHDVVPKSTAGVYKDCPNLIRIEVRGEVNSSIYLNHWNPTNALDASRTDLIEEGSTAANNLQQFLENFRDYIAKKLANRTGLSKLTLTLSAGVFSAVFTNESGSTEEIVARNAIRDEIRGEITDRNWKVTDSTNNFNN